VANGKTMLLKAEGESRTHKAMIWGLAWEWTDGWLDGCVDFDSKQVKDVRRHISHAFLRGRTEARRMDKLVYFSLFSSMSSFVVVSIVVLTYRIVWVSFMSI